MEVSADIVVRTADIAEAGAGHKAAGHRAVGRMVAGEGVARALAARHMVAVAAAAARRSPLAVAAGSIGPVEVRRRRVEEEAGLHTVGEMAHRMVEKGAVVRSPGEAEETADSIGPGPEVEARRMVGEVVAAGSTPLVVGEAALFWLANVKTDAPEHP
jgi:hypothetical protein